MATTTTTTQIAHDYDIPKGGYVAFDAVSLRQLIVNRLNEQKTFTDQNFIGSNLAAIIDIIAYSYHTLIYYLNKTSTESMFSEAQIYENINRIVKLIDYSPIGDQTSTLSFVCSATTTSINNQLLLPRGVYSIPRYSYVITNGIPFSFNEDIAFVKETNTLESLDEISEQKLLYQGEYIENPVYIAAGDDNETVILNPGDEIVDHFNLDVYVKSINTGKWEQWTKTANLFLETGFAKKYEVRLNHNKRYEFKFGNDINGVKLQQGDRVAIYYMSSLGANGEIGPRALNTQDQTRFIAYNTIQYNEIMTDLFGDEYRFLTTADMRNLFFSNAESSTPFKTAQNSDEVRRSAPDVYRSQYRLVTTRDYEVFVKTNFANLIADVKCINNWDYIAGYLKYYYDIGLTDATKTERALLNQIQYSDSCNFNNVYLIVVPRSGSQNFNYLVPAQKELINAAMVNSKITTVETVFIDPVYKAAALGVTSSPSTLDPIFEETQCYLEVRKRINSRRDNQSLTNDIVAVFRNYFNRDRLALGEILDTRSLTQQILSIDGVESIYTKRQDDPSVSTEGISFFVWNPLYPNNDKTVTTGNLPLREFEYSYFYNIETLANKIQIINTQNTFEVKEY